MELLIIILLVLVNGVFAMSEMSLVSSRKFKLENGGVHDGYWKNGVPHGFGKVTYENGDTYEGEFIDGKREG